MRKYFIAVFVAALFLAPSVQLAHAAPGDSYISAGLSGSGGNLGPAVSVGTLIAPPTIGLSLDVMNYGGHGVVGSMLGYIPIQEGAKAFIGAGVSHQSISGISDTGIAYTVGMQFEAADGGLIRLAAMQTQFNASNVNAFVFSIGKRF